MHFSKIVPAKMGFNQLPERQKKRFAVHLCISIFHSLQPHLKFSDEWCDFICQMWEVCICALQLQIYFIEFQKHVTDVCKFHEELVTVKLVGKITALFLQKNANFISQFVTAIGTRCETEPLCGRSPFPRTVPKKSGLWQVVFLCSWLWQWRRSLHRSARDSAV